MKPSRFAAACIGLLLQIATTSEVFAADASLSIFWSIPLPRREYPVSEFTIRKTSVDRQGSIAALVWNGNRYLLLLDPNEQQPTALSPSLKGDPIILQIAHGPDGALWLAGRANRRSSGPGRDFADPYLAKVDRSGRVVAEHAFGRNRFQQIRDLSPLASGNVIMVRQEDSEVWVESTTPGGPHQWRSRVPALPNRSVTLAVTSQRVLVAGVEEAKVDGKLLREDAVLWTFDSAGVPVERVVLRQGHDRRDSHRVKMQYGREAVYLLINTDWGARTPTEVVKVSNEGKILWRTEIPETLRERSTKVSAVCEPGSMVSPNDDLLIVCSLERRILFVLMKERVHGPDLRRHEARG